MRSIDDLQDAFSALESDPPDADDVLAVLQDVGRPPLHRAVRAWGAPVAVVALHGYDQRGNAVSPATAAPSMSASPPVAVGTQFTQALPVPVGNAGLNYGFTIGPITGCTSSMGSITRRYQQQIVSCGAAGTTGSVGTTASVFLFYKGAFDPPVLGANASLGLNGEPAYQTTLPSPDSGSMVTALVWQYAPDGWAMVAEPAPATVRADEVAHCVEAAPTSADSVTTESVAPTAPAASAKAQQSAAEAILRARQSAAAAAAKAEQSAAAASAATTPEPAAKAAPPDCVAVDVSATVIAEAVRPASLQVTVPLRLDLPGLYIHNVDNDSLVGGNPTGAIGFSALPETTAGAAQKSGDTWNLQYGIGAMGFPDVDTTGAIVNFTAAGQQWAIYHDRNGAATVLVLKSAGQFVLLVTPGKGRSVSDADFKALAAEITLPPTPSDPSTWFDISTVLP